MLIDCASRSLRQLPAGRFALQLVWQATRGWTVLWGCLLLCQGLLPAVLAVLLRSLVNRLAHAADWRLIVPIAAGIAGLWIGGQLIASVLNFTRTVQAEKLQDLVYRRIHEQALKLDLAFFDRKESYDLLFRARNDAATQPLQLLESLGSLLQNGSGFLLMAGILWGYAFWLPLLICGCGVPGLLLLAQRILKEHAWNLKHTVQERRVRYLDWLLTDQTTAAELRVYGLGSYLRSNFETFRMSLREGKIDLAREGAVAELSAGALAWLGCLVGLGWMLHLTVHRLVGLGDLLFGFQAFQQSQIQLRALLDGAGKIFRSLLFIENLNEFFEQKTELPASPIARPGLPLHSGIRFEQVSFAYPGSSRNALEQFDLEIPAGKVVALVGENGAGKSTLVKLLCRFYNPDRGRILFDGEDLRNLDPEALRRRIGILFQDPVRYQATVRENIGFGEVVRLDDEARLWRAVCEAGADPLIARFPGGVTAQLGKWFGGTELSGGEWQRIALARAFFRDAPLVILDEPTSAMDSWAELDWIERFRCLTMGKTALMITHRFTTAMHADIIHVLERGRIVESGTHAGLIASHGRYAYSWKAQTREHRSDSRGHEHAYR